MIGFYTPIVLLQAFCLYHAYNNNAEHRWYWFILIFPGFGCALYLFHHFSNRKSINTLAESVKGVVNNNYRIEQLEKAYRFSDNLANQISLADAYVDYKRYDEAIKLYQASLTGFMSDDPSLRMKLLQAHFLNGNHADAIILGNDLEGEKVFRNAEQRLAYAWALHYDKKTETAEKIFLDMAKPFTNYKHRIEFCKFLLDTGKKEQFKTLLSEIIEEFDHVRGPERRLYRGLISEARSLYSTHVAR